MKLSQIATDNLRVDIDVMDAELAKEIQTRLTALGCLDPPADGSFGISTAATNWAVMALAIAPHKK